MQFLFHNIVGIFKTNSTTYYQERQF